MFLDLSLHAPFGYIDRSLAVYRVVAGSISHPRDEVSRREWDFHYFRIKRDYVESPHCPAKIRKRAEVQLHLSMLELGWASGSAETFEEGYSWLSQNDPESIGWWSHRVRKRAIESGISRRAVRRLESWGIGPSMLGRLRRRSRRWP